MFEWLESLPLKDWVATSEWAYPTLLTFHGLGMAVVVGVTLVTTLRVLGFPKRIPLGAYKGLLPWLVGAFIINAGTGVTLFVSDAVTLAANPSFQIKVASLIVGIVVLCLLYSRVINKAARYEADLAAAGPGAEPPADFPITTGAKALALAALLLWWLSVIVSGRLVAYIGLGA